MYLCLRIKQQRKRGKYEREAKQVEREVSCRPQDVY